MKRGKVIFLAVLMALIVAGVGIYAYATIQKRDSNITPGLGARLIGNSMTEQKRDKVRVEFTLNDGCGNAGLGLAGEREVWRAEYAEEAENGK